MQQWSLEMQVEMQELSFRTRQSGYLPPHKMQHDTDKTQHDKYKMQHDRDKDKYNVPGQIREPDHVLPHNMQHDKDKDKMQGQLSKADVQHHTVGVQCLKVHRFARSQGASLPLPLTQNACNRSRSHKTCHTAEQKTCHTTMACEIEIADMPYHSQQTWHTTSPSTQQTWHTTSPSTQQTWHTTSPSTWPSEAVQASSLGHKMCKMCANGLCPSPMRSKKWRVVTAGTSAGARDWYL